MAWLDNLLQVSAWLIISVPIGVLIISTLLYFLLPSKRLAIGITLVTLGTFGLFIFSITMYLSLAHENTKMIGLSTILLSVELMTLIVGMISLIRHRILQRNIANPKKLE